MQLLQASVAGHVKCRRISAASIHAGLMLNGSACMHSRSSHTVSHTRLKPKLPLSVCKARRRRRCHLAHAAAQPRQRQLPRREQQRRVGEHERVQGGRGRAAQARSAICAAGQGRQIRLQAARAGLAAARLQVLQVTNAKSGNLVASARRHHPPGQPNSEPGRLLWPSVARLRDLEAPINSEYLLCCVSIIRQCTKDMRRPISLKLAGTRSPSQL